MPVLTCCPEALPRDATDVMVDGRPDGETTTGAPAGADAPASGCGTGYLAASTLSVKVAVTSGCSRTCAWYAPMLLMWPGICSRRRSNTGPPAALTASTTSDGVTEPNRRPPSPARAR